MATIELIKEQRYKENMEEAVALLNVNGINAYIDESLIFVSIDDIDKSLGLLDGNGFVFNSVGYDEENKRIKE